MTGVNYKVRRYVSHEDSSPLSKSHHDIHQRNREIEGWRKNSEMLPDNAFADDAVNPDSGDVATYFSKETHIEKDYIE